MIKFIIPAIAFLAACNTGDQPKLKTVTNTVTVTVTDTPTDVGVDTDLPTDTDTDTPTDVGDIDPDADYDKDSFSINAGDCDDFDANTFPGSAEIDSLVDCMKDYDGDGYGDDGHTGLVMEGVTFGTDCDDGWVWNNPGTTEHSCDDTSDNDCDGLVDLDDPECVPVCSLELVLGPFQNDSYCNGLTVAAAATPDELMQSEIGGVPYLYYMEGLVRHFVSGDSVLESWWGADDCGVCEQVTLIDDVTVLQYVLDANLTIRPGAFIIGIASDPSRYVIDACATIRNTDDVTLEAIYGIDWLNFVRIVPDIFFVDYTMGPDVVTAADYDLLAAQARSLTDELACP